MIKNQLNSLEKAANSLLIEALKCKDASRIKSAWLCPLEKYFHFPFFFSQIKKETIVSGYC